MTNKEYPYRANPGLNPGPEEKARAFFPTPTREEMRKKWEYLIVSLDDIFVLEKNLNDFGLDGWELFQILDTRFYFKRERVE